MPNPTLSADELQQWARYVHQISGIQLDSSKGYLIETRLGLAGR